MYDVNDVLNSLNQIRKQLSHLESLKHQVDTLERQLQQTVPFDDDWIFSKDTYQKLSLERNIVSDLQKERYGGKYLYSYSDIAQHHGISLSKVARIAAKYNISRQKEIY